MVMKCYICFEEMERPVEVETDLACGCSAVMADSVHQDCKRAWLRRKNTCPVCREEIPRQTVWDKIVSVNQRLLSIGEDIVALEEVQTDTEILIRLLEQERRTLEVGFESAGLRMFLSECGEEDAEIYHGYISRMARDRLVAIDDELWILQEKQRNLFRVIALRYEEQDEAEAEFNEMMGHEFQQRMDERLRRHVEDRMEAFLMDGGQGHFI